MHTITALALALAGSAVAAPVIRERDGSKGFRLNVSGGPLDAWALLQSHVTQGVNAVEILRPSEYVSEVVRLDDSKPLAQLQSSTMAGANFKYVLPVVESGDVQQVFAESRGGTKAFEFKSGNMLTAYGRTDVFWACPSSTHRDGKPFILWYGVDVDTAKLPSEECQSIELVATWM